MKFKSMLKDKRGVFGLPAVQAFFATILGIAILAFVILVIMYNLSASTVLPTDSLASNQSIAILGNVSSGMTAFFGAISPVWSILAILVIILVLVVLVRIVQAPMSGNSGQTQL